MTNGEKLLYAINTVMLIIIVVITLYPMWYVVIASFSDANKILSGNSLIILPQGLNFDSYKAVFQNPMIYRGYFNTIFILAVSLIINLLLTSFGAYFLSRRDIKMKKFVMTIVVITMFFSGGLIPLYLTVKEVGIFNTLWSVILPSSINTFNLIIMRTAFMSVPRGMEESAEIDGANDLTILFRILIPLSMSTMAVMILYYGVGHWNAWFNASIFITDKTLYPLQLILREILIQNDTSLMAAASDAGDRLQISETIKYATIVVATAPILIVYPFLQKYFEKGVMVGALKG